MADLDPRVHQPLSFVCGSGLPGCLTTFTERSERELAGMVLEDCGDWLLALGKLERTRIPDGVRDALAAAHEAVAGWVDFLERGATRAAGGTQ